MWSPLLTRPCAQASLEAGRSYIPHPFSTLCPGRTRSAEPQDVFHLRLFDDDVVLDKMLHTHVYCSKISWTQVRHLRSDFCQCLRRQLTADKAVFGSPTSSVDPVQPKDIFQSGGSVSCAVGALVPMVASDSKLPLLDSSGMDRWIDITTIAPLGSSFHQEITHLCSLSDPSPRPRHHIIKSLIFVQMITPFCSCWMQMLPLQMMSIFNCIVTPVPSPTYTP